MLNNQCLWQMLYYAYDFFFSDQMLNAHSMISCKLIPELLMRLHDLEMADGTTKAMINVINALLANGPTDEDIRRSFYQFDYITCILKIM